MENVPLSVSDAIAFINQTLEYAYPTVLIEGEISSFKINKEKYVFFDIKDEASTLGCFMMVFQLRTPLEDGMRVQIVASPKLTQWGKFSLTVREIRPTGEGSLKRSFELLVAKLKAEGLLAAERKRPLPTLPQHIGVISSTQAAGYSDFITILDKRWGGIEIEVANVQVQGAVAPNQIIKALEHFNSQAEPPEVIVLLRGGGSADDLSAFNDEPLVRSIAASRVPVLTGIGHEVDVSLTDLVADMRASTPSNAAEILVPDRREILASVNSQVFSMLSHMSRQLTAIETDLTDHKKLLSIGLQNIYDDLNHRSKQLSAVLSQLDPRSALKRGYALVRNEAGQILKAPPFKGAIINIEMAKYNLKAGVIDAQKKQ